jgi:hypothetical protein
MLVNIRDIHPGYIFCGNGLIAGCRHGLFTKAVDYYKHVVVACFVLYYRLKVHGHVLLRVV